MTDFWVKILAMLLIFFIAVGGTIANVYANTLFLSTYPRSFIIYYLITQAIITTVVSFVIMPLFIQKIKQNSIILMLVFVFLSACIMIFFNPEIQHSGSLLSFIIALLISLLSPILSVLGWAIVPLAFGLREYKKALPHISIAGGLGAIIGGLQVPLFLKYFSINALLLLPAVYIIIGCIITYLLQVKEQQKTRSTTSSPLKYPLYLYFLIYFAGLIAIQALVDYSFKFEVSKAFSKEDIGIFLGYFSGITSTLGLLGGLAITKKFLQLVQIDGLLYVTPLFIFISSLLLVFFPSLWAICIVMSSRSLFFFNHARLGTEITLNILPSAARIAGKAQLQSVIAPLVTVLVFIFLLTVKHFATTQVIAILVLLLSIVCLFYVKKISFSYRKTLQQETEFRRFNIFNKVDPANKKAFHEMISNSLKTNDDDLKLMCIGILNINDFQEVPQQLYLDIQHPNSLIRKTIIMLIQTKHDIKSLPYLVNQLKVEQDSMISVEIFNTIAELNFKVALNIAKNIDKNSSNSLYLAALFFLLKQKGKEHDSVLSELRQLISHNNSSVRKKLAELIGYYKTIELEKELGHLIQDQEPKVSEAAIKAAVRTNSIGLIRPVILQLVSDLQSSASHSISVHSGNNPTSLLLPKLASSKTIFIMIKALAEIPGTDSEQTLLALARNGNIYLSMQVAKQANFRACHQSTSDSFKLKAKELALEAISHINFLEQLAKQYTLQPVLNEIESRKKLAMQRTLLWLSVATHAIEISQLIPSLLSSNKSPNYQQAHGKALELLEIYITDSHLKYSIINLLEPETCKTASHPTMHQYVDGWLEQVVYFANHPEERGDMDILQKVFALRSIELFKNMPSEILIYLAEEIEEISFNPGDIIFNENDPADRLYCITSGTVEIIRQHKILDTLHVHDFFGELALIDDSVRAATAVAKTDCSLLLLEKSTFDRITDDMPDVLKIVVKVILGYLRKNMQ